MRFTRRFYYLGLVLVAGLSFGLRFWQLGRFNSLVFDEVYYVKFAQAYLAGGTVFDAHPPLGKYAIAASIWLYEQTPWLHLANQNMTADVNLASVSYRWMNALVGALIPLVVVGLAHSLTGGFRASRNWMFGILAGGFVAVDGLFVTESRYGLLNIYVVFFGLLGHWLWIAAAGEKRWTIGVVLRGVSGVALGAAIATKWNGLGYVLALVIWECFQPVQKTTALSSISFFRRGHTDNLLKGFLYLGVLPLLTYSVIWWPHLQLNEGSFWSIHRTLFLFHQGLYEVQAACSRWFTWPLLIKPIAYWYETSDTRAYTVNNLGNPALWWFSAASVVLLGTERLARLVSNIKHRLYKEKVALFVCDGESRPQKDVVVYLLTGQAANWLPWMLVERCTYNYSYMPAAVFGFMLLAWLLSGWLAIDAPVSSRWFGFIVVSAIALAFFFWLPLALGSPLSLEQLSLRWWLPSWI